MRYKKVFLSGNSLKEKKKKTSSLNAIPLVHISIVSLLGVTPSLRILLRLQWNQNVVELGLLLWEHLVFEWAKGVFLIFVKSHFDSVSRHCRFSFSKWSVAYFWLWYLIIVFKVDVVLIWPFSNVEGSILYRAIEPIY